MFREVLRNKLGAAMRAVTKERRTITLQTTIRRDEGYVRIRSTVHPVDPDADSETLLLISFEDEGTMPSAISLESPEEAIVGQLESELKGTREELEGSMDAFRSLVQDLNASSEEAVSTNEELQSANEELESSKEEMHSLNEELLSANQQLHGKVEQLEVVNAFSFSH